MQLSDIPGQQAIKEYFLKIIDSQRVPHAIMITGGDGYGKLALAIGLAGLLECKNRTATGACGECSSCLKAQKNIHPDIHFSFPVIKKDNIKRAETTSTYFLNEWREFLNMHPYGNLTDWLTFLGASDKQANINVAECNEIIKNLSLMTYEGQYKIQIIWYADYLGKEGNRILKLIEEPSDNTIIILILNNSNAVLNTLKSRCQSILVPPFEDEDIKSYVSQNSSLSDNDQQELVHLVDGNLRMAIESINSSQLNYSEDLMSWFRYSYKSDPEEVVTFVETMVRNGKQENINFLNYGLHFLREMHQLLAQKSKEKLKLTEEEKIVAEKLVKLIDMNKIGQLEEIFTQSIGHIRRNLSLKILLMSMTFEINAILKAEVDNLVAK
jgi:DNA polymerase-3 subunit delta'